MGNELLCFAILVIIELILVNGFALLEHPAEPEDQQAASIWRLPILRALSELPQVQIIRFAQGLMGSASAKPTNILTLNIPGLLSLLHANRVRTELPKVCSIGRDHLGRWKTTALKEYAPALCRCLASALFQAVQETPVNPVRTEPTPSQVKQFLSMVIQVYGSEMGADFNVRRT